MKSRYWLSIFILFCFIRAQAQIKPPKKSEAVHATVQKGGENNSSRPKDNARHLQTLFSNHQVSVAVGDKSSLFIYKLLATGKILGVSFPVIEINGKPTKLVVDKWKSGDPAVVLRNNVSEYSVTGNTVLKGLSIRVIFRVAPDNPIIKFRYELIAEQNMVLTKSHNKDNINYFSVQLKNTDKVKEVRLSEFNEKAHATHLTEAVISPGMFRNGLSAMGPIMVWGDNKQHFLIAYEHGSQYPDRFLEYKFTKERSLTLDAVKSNYLSNQQLSQGNPFQTIWFEIGAVTGNEEKLAATYREFILQYIAENTESRKPYIFYNTWGRQERVKWRGGTYRQTLTLDYTLNEIDQAHKMGIEVYVIDAGWFERTGDWKVNKALFPDGLKQVNAKLDGYGMKLGLWFNPTSAGINSNMLKKNMANRVMRNGAYPDSSEIWETEYSKNLCLVSSYWNDFADELIEVVKETGVSYFKWDAIWQYGCSAPGHEHGSLAQSEEERMNSFAFQLPTYMGKVIDKVHATHPEVIVDFDITEDGRSVGLQFLAHGKYFIINNGPYYHNFDVSAEWKGPTADGNPNIFVNAGTARGWFTRSVLDYDKWLPSILFLTHYYPYAPEWSQMQSIASLILGQNGIWGEIDSVNTEGVSLFNQHLSWYKQVRDDVTKSTLVQTGFAGDSHEIYEKVNSQTGKGVIVLFANHKGEYNYISKARVTKKMIVPDGVTIVINPEGYAVIKATCNKNEAKIIYFGA